MNTPRRPRKAPVHEVRPSIQRLLDAMTGIPAFVRNGRLDVLAVNAMGRALYCQAFDSQTRPVNLARFVFLNPEAHLLHPNWSDWANTSVSILRTEAGRNPYDKGLDRPGGGAVHAQRGVPHPLGSAQRPAAPIRHQTLPVLSGRRSSSEL